MGVSRSRVKELARGGFRIKKHLTGIKIIRNSPYTVKDRDDVGEILAVKTVLLKHLNPGDEISPPSPQKGVDIVFENGATKVLL